MTSLQELEQRFWSQVHLCSHGVRCYRCCWEWQGRKTRLGYGKLVLDGQIVGAHRLALELAHGACLLPFTFGCFAHSARQPLRILGLHRCDNPSCVNWHHLFVGTYQDNIRDAIRKGRWHNGTVKRRALCLPYSR